MFDFADYSAIQWWRFCYSIVSLVVLLFVVSALRYRIHDMKPSQIYGAFTLVGFLFSSTVASVESLYHNDPLSLRTPFYTATLAFCILALYAASKEKRANKHQAKKLAESMVEHLQTEDDKHGDN